MRRFDDEDLTGAEFRECDLSRARLVGVVMQDAEIDGLVTNSTSTSRAIGPPSPAHERRPRPLAAHGGTATPSVIAREERTTAAGAVNVD